MQSQDQNSKQVLDIKSIEQIPQLTHQEFFNNQYKEIRIQMQNFPCTDIKESAFYKITSFLRKLTSNKLQILIVDFECSEGLAEKFRYTYEEIFELKKALSHLMKKIRVFQLNLNNWGYQNLGLMPDNCFPSFFADIFEKMEEIEEITINLKSIDHNNSTTKTTLNSIIDHIKFAKLRKLSIDIEHPSNQFAQNRFNPNHFEGFFNKIIKNGKELQSLKLNVNRFNLSLRSFEILIEGLKSFQNLEEIGLQLLQKSEIENDEIIESYTQLAKIIFELPKMQAIQFQHSFHNITEQLNIEYIKTLTQIFDQNKFKLKSFKLQILAYNITESDTYLKFLIKFGRYFGGGLDQFPFIMRIGNQLYSKFERAYFFGISSRIQSICLINEIQKYFSKYRPEIIYALYDKCF